MARSLMGCLGGSGLAHLVLSSLILGMISFVAPAPAFGVTLPSFFHQEETSSLSRQQEGNEEDSSEASDGEPHAFLMERVNRFWNAFAEGDYQTLASLVESGSEQLLMTRYAFPVQEWKVAEVEWIDDALVEVTVDASFRLPPAWKVMPVRLEQRWRKVKIDWILEMKALEPSNPLEILYGEPRKAEARTEGLQIKPAVLVMHFLNSPQRGVLYLTTESAPVEIARIDLDEESFRLVDFVSEVKGGEGGEIVIEYVGSTLEKDLESKLTLYVRSGSGETRYEIPVVYNYLSPALKAFFSLDEQKIEQLEPGAVLQPSID